MRKYIPFIILVIVITLIGYSTYNLNKKQEIVQEVKLNKKTNQEIHKFQRIRINLPEFSLIDLYDPNKAFQKNDLIGKYSIINFFASWCATCHAEHDLLMKLKEENIVNIYGIAWRDIDENTKKYLKKNGNPFTKTAKDNSGFFSKVTYIKALPETVIVNPKGDIIRRYRGNLQESLLEEIRHLCKKKKCK